MTRTLFLGTALAALLSLAMPAAAQDPGGVNPTEPYATQKTCAVAPAPDGLNHQVTCTVVIDHPALVNMPFGDPPAPPSFTVIDRLTLNGQPIAGAVQTATVSAGAGLQTCLNAQYLDGGYAGFPTGPLPTSAGYGCGVTAAPGSVQTTVTIVALIPLDTHGMAQNCATTQHGIPVLPDALIASPPSCAQIDLPRRRPNDPLPIAPVQCEVFTPEVTCNTVTGKPVVTLKNKYAKLFSPKSVKITSLTPGVTLQQSTAGPLSVQLTGAGPGDTISLSTEAVEKGAGSEPGLDLCCMGEVQVTIPQGFICEAEQVLEVTKTCDTGINPAIDTDADCEITVHYEGPAPTAANPIKIVEAVTGAPWAFTTTPLSSDNWNCPAVPDATPFTCTISASDEPTANWQNWTSTLIVQMSVGEAFENCVTATAAGGLEDRVCWSTELPELTIEKLADQDQCRAGEPCTFTINVSNPSAVDYAGPVTLSDQIVGANPSVLTDPGTFTSISPALCDPSDLVFGACTGQASIPAGGTQSYTVTWMPPTLVAGATGTAVTNCASGAFATGEMTVVGAPDGSFGEPAFGAGQSCATVNLTDDDISIVKTGPDQCLPGLPCDYQVTIAAGEGGYNGPMLLGDQAPAGFEVTAITPVPVGCGVNLPAQNLACVIPLSLNAGESVSYTIAITPMGGTLDAPFFGENCALLGAVSEGAGPADYSFSGETPSDEFMELIQNSTLLGESCVPVTWDPVDDPDLSGDVTVVKTCTPLAEEDSPFLSWMTSCTITATVTGSGYPGEVYLTDYFSGPNGGTLGALTPSGPGWTCSAGNCLLGPVGPGVYQVTAPVTGIVLNQGEVAMNCAQFYTVLPPSNDGNPPALPVVKESCVLLTPPGGGDQGGAGTLSVTKTCSPAIALNATGLSAAECTITVSGTGTLPDTIRVEEGMLSYADASHAGGNSPLNITSVTSAENWQVSALPSPQGTMNGGAAAPVVATLTGGELQAAGGQSVLTVGVQFQDIGWAMESENCVQAFGGDAAGNPLSPPVQSEKVCAQFAPPPQKPDALTVTKTCTPNMEQGDIDMDRIPDTITCQITVTVAPGYGNGLIVLEDFLQDATQAQASVATITGVTSTDPWDCTIAGQVTGPGAKYCTILSDDMAGSTSTLMVTMADDPNPTPGSHFNCVRHTDAAGSGYVETPFACAPITYPSGGNKVAEAPVLTLTKTSIGPCLPDVVSQTYACGFDLTVTNAGAAFAGPMVLGDAFDPGMVSAVSTTAAGWTCNLAGDAASCINGNLSLGAGASVALGLDVTVTGLPKGGTFGNCATLGAGDDPKAQTIIVQTALTLMGVDIGAVDGVAGKRTRAAVADLQEQLGLPPTGEIDAALLKALGVPMAGGPESCVTVDLPPMPEPPLQCEKATTVLKDGECACRYRNMYQADRNSCGCVKGTEFVAGEGCLKVKVKDKPKDTSTELACDPETTVLRGGKCQCREEGMERVSKTACAFPKKKKIEVRICPNGLPEIPGVGCVEIELKRKEKVPVDEGRCDPAVQECG